MNRKEVMKKARDAFFAWFAISLFWWFVFTLFIAEYIDKVPTK